MVTLFAFLLSTAHGFEVRSDEFGQALQWQRTTIRYQVNSAGNHGLSTGGGGRHLDQRRLPCMDLPRSGQPPLFS
jgi:hypothetical protein